MHEQESLFAASCDGPGRDRTCHLGIESPLLNTNAASATPASKTSTFQSGQFGSKSVSEGSTTGWALTNVDCGSATDSDNTLAGVTVNLQPGDNVTCTYTNTQDATLTVVKETTPANSGSDAFGFTHVGTGVTNFTLDTNGSDSTNPNHVSFTFTVRTTTTA